MEIYSEYMNGDRKATVCLINRHGDPRLKMWEVTLYIKDRVIQKTTSVDEITAENLAEDFVQGTSSGGVTFLSERIING